MRFRGPALSMPRRTQNARMMVVRRLPKEAKVRHAMTHGSGGIEAPSALFRDMICQCRGRAVQEPVFLDAHYHMNVILATASLCKWETAESRSTWPHHLTPHDAIKTPPKRLPRNDIQGTEEGTIPHLEETRAKPRRPSTVDWTANPCSVACMGDATVQVAPLTPQNAWARNPLHTSVRGPDKPGATSCVCVADRRLGHPKMHIQLAYE
ncbi:hypothetical protein GGI35DRAFT_408542 [Trichoderma velutinum]